MVTLQPTGGNKLFDFKRLSTTENEDLSPSDDFSSYTSFHEIYTDWHSPFYVSATNNADGDNKKADGTHKMYFTGGNHQYNNQGSGSTRTARLDNVHFFADGEKITDGIGSAYNMEIRWTNYIQGYNTTKADGSGREILQENHTLRFDGLTWTSEVELKALEDICITRWYGFQASLGAFNKAIRYVGGNTSDVFEGKNTASSSGSKYCSKVLCTGAEHCLEIELDEAYGLGNRDYVKNYDGCFVTTYNKVYHTIIDTRLNLSEGESCYIRGKYRFYPV